MKKTILLLFAASALLLFLPFISAQTCSVSVNADNTKDFLREVSTLNQAFQTCPQPIPSPLHRLTGDEKVAMNIHMQSGTNEVVAFQITGDHIVGAEWGGTGNGWVLETDECAFDTILKHDDKGLGVYAYAYTQNRLDIKAIPIGKKIILLIFKPFINAAANKLATPVTIECDGGNANTNNAPRGKPEYCDETYLPGHREYANNKELWDSYSLDTDGVCQSQFGKPAPSPCVHMIQLSINGNPYYLCWYNE